MAEESFQLVFRGEVLEGQARPAVIERIGTLLKLEASQTEALFSGRTVVLKRNVAKAVAARYLAAFRTAGARLRVLPSRDRAPAAPTPAAPTRAEQALVSPAGDAEPADMPLASWSLAAADAGFEGREDERPAPAAALIDVALSAAPPNTGSFADVLPPAPQPPPAPDVLALAVDPPGVDLSVPRQVEAPLLDLSRLTLAEAGADIGPGAVPAVPRAAPDLEVLPAGTELDTLQREAPPPPPDVSHLKLS